MVAFCHKMIPKRVFSFDKLWSRHEHIRYSSKQRGEHTENSSAFKRKHLRRNRSKDLIGLKRLNSLLKDNQSKISKTGKERNKDKILVYLQNTLGIH